MAKRLLVEAPSLTDEQDKAFREAVLTGKARVSRRRFMALLGLTPAMAMAQTWQPLGASSGAPLTWQKLDTENCSPGTWCKVIKPPFRATITTHQQQMNLATWAAAKGWNGSEPAEITIAPGVYIWSDNTAVAGLTTGVFPGGLTIINQGYIIGKGGEGGGAENGSGALYAATAGGPALSLSCACSIDNRGYIAGGGGGGGGGIDMAAYNVFCGGGGAGGGAGGRSAGYIAAGGAGGVLGASGSNGVLCSAMDRFASGGGGGRILPGTGGPAKAGTRPAIPGSGGGSGGSGSICGTKDFGKTNLFYMYLGGGGGGWGARGGTGYYWMVYGVNPSTAWSGAGGTENANGGSGTGGGMTPTGGQQLRVFPGAAGGNAVKRNGYAITWIAMGTVWGAVS